VSVGGVKRSLHEGETWTTTSGGHQFSVRRGDDAVDAKDMFVTVLS
jgi:hypothetical protein